MNETASSPPKTKQLALAELLQRKLVMRPAIPGTAVQTGAGDGSPRAGWLLRRDLERLLACWPAALLHDLARAAHGYIVITNGQSAYMTGPFDVAGRQVESIALLGTGDLQAAPEAAGRALAQLVDHLLGSGIRGPLRPISDGTAPGATWAEFPRRLLGAYRLAYHEHPGPSLAPGGYFAWAFALYCLSRRQLLAEDPLACRLLHSTVFSDAFWRGHPLEDDTCGTT